MSQKWFFEKIDENGKLIRCPSNDTGAKITGKYILNLPAWFNENPAERIRLGWIKHLYTPSDEIEYNKKTQFYTVSTCQIDEYTVEDTYTVLDKPPEVLAQEELNQVVDNHFYKIGGND